MVKNAIPQKDTFAGCHPLVNFLYFALVLVFSMCLMHPVCLLISLCSAAVYSAKQKNSFRFILPLMILTAVLNPLLTHAGMTILTYLPSGNPLTLESIWYGLAAAAMLSAVVLWFSCYNAVMTSDKFVYLFGRVIPSLSLVLSMALRFVPRFQAQMRVVREAQCAVGRKTMGQSMGARSKNSIKILSIMITWSLENVIETADSMRGRGYGLPGRTAFSIYHFDRRDKRALCYLGFCGIYLLAGWAAGGAYFQYYPYVDYGHFTPFSASFFAVYLLLCLMPILMDGAAQRSWKATQAGGQSNA